MCQVNPHIVPVLRYKRFWNSLFMRWLSSEVGEKETGFFSVTLCHSVARRRFVFSHVTSLSTMHQVRFRMEQLAAAHLMPRGLNNVRSVLAQKYDGDITIVPDMTIDDYMQYDAAAAEPCRLRVFSLFFLFFFCAQHPPSSPPPSTLSASCPIQRPSASSGPSRSASARLGPNYRSLWTTARLS